MAGAFFDLIGRDRASGPFLRVAAAADKAAASEERLSAAQNKVIAGMGAVGSKLTRTVTLPFLAIAGASVKVATDFSSSMTRIQTQAGASAKDVRLLSAQVLNLSKSAQQGPVDLANALYHLKSVGLGNAQAMKALKQASDLAAVGGADLEDTTNALAGAWRTGIRGAKDFHQAVSTVNAIIGAGNMSMTDFNDALSTGILPTAKTFGLTMKDVGSALALFTDEGVPANAAATRLRMSFSLLGAPSEKAEKQLESIGLTGLKLANDMRKPNGLIVAIGDLKSHLDASGLSLSEQAQLLSHAFGGGRSSSAILSLVNNFDVLQKKQAQVTAGMSKFGAAVKAQAATPAAQFHQAIASLETAGVQLGNAVLPSVVKLTHGITDVVRWFDNLTPAVKTFLITAGGIAAIAGPVLLLGSAVGRLGRVFITSGLGVARFIGGLRQAEMSMTNMQSSSYAFGNRIGTAWANASRGVKLFSTALAGAAIGASIGELTKNADSGAKAAGALASAMAGAAVGFQMGGPWGAAIGGATGLLGDLATAFGGVSQSEKNAAAAQQTYTNAVKQSLSMMSQQAQKQAALNLANNGTLDLLAALHNQNMALGTSYGDLQRAVGGSQRQFNTLIAQMKGYGAAGALIIQSLQAERTGLQQAISTRKRYEQAQAQAADHAKIYARNLTTAGHASAMLGSEANGATAPIQHLSGTTKTAGKSFTDATLSAKAFTKALAGIGSNQITAAQSEIQFQQDLAGLKSAWDKNSNAIIGNSKAALTNRSALLNLINDAKQHAADLQAEGKGNIAVTKSLDNQIRSIKQQALAAGASTKQWRAFLQQIHATPKDVNVALHLAAAKAQQYLDSIASTLKYLEGTHTVVVNASVRGNLGSTRNQQVPGRASGGGAPNGWYWTGERGPELNYKQGPNVQIYPADQSKGIAAMMGTKVPGYATGTGPTAAETKARQALATLLSGIGSGPSGPSFTVATQHQLDRVLKQIRHARDLMRADFKDGLITAKQEANDKKRLHNLAQYARDQLKKAQQAAAATSLGNLLGKVGQAPSLPFTIGQGTTAAKVLAQITAAQAKLDKGGLSDAMAKKYQREIDRYTKLAQKQIAHLKVHIDTTDLNNISKALKGTPADIRSAFATMFTDIKNAGGAVTAQMTAAESKLIAGQRDVLALQNRLAAARQFRSGIRSTLAGQYDITQSGSISDLITGLHGATNTNDQYTSAVKRLAHRFHGNKAGMALLKQLEQSGNTATLQSLAGGSLTEDLRAARAFRGYQGSLTAGSNAATTVKMGESVDRMAKALAADREHQTKLVEAMGKVVAASIHAQSKPMQLDGKPIRVIADQSAERALTGALDYLDGLIRHGHGPS